MSFFPIQSISSNNNYSKYSLNQFQFQQQPKHTFCSDAQNTKTSKKKSFSTLKIKSDESAKLQRQQELQKQQRLQQEENRLPVLDGSAESEYPGAWDKQPKQTTQEDGSQKKRNPFDDDPDLEGMKIPFPN